MNKPLSEIDSLYKQTISKLPKKERLSYCESLIDKAQLNLIRNKKKINPTVATELQQIMLSAQEEMVRIKAEK